MTAFGQTAFDRIWPIFFGGVGCSLWVCCGGVVVVLLGWWVAQSGPGGGESPAESKPTTTRNNNTTKTYQQKHTQQHDTDYNHNNTRKFDQNTKKLKLAKVGLAKVGLAKVGHDRPFTPAFVHVGGSNVAPMFSGPTLSDVLQFSSWRCCINVLLP